jgi:hypothetical protein
MGLNKDYPLPDFISNCTFEYTHASREKKNVGRFRSALGKHFNSFRTSSEIPNPRVEKKNFQIWPNCVVRMWRHRMITGTSAGLEKVAVS